MKKSIIFLFAMLMGFAAFAQERGAGRGERRQRQFDPESIAMAQTNALDKVVDLDSIQYQIVYLMNYSDAVAMQDSIKARQTRREEMRRNGQEMKFQRPTEEEIAARRQVMEERQAIRNAQMKEILTPGQYEKYLQYEKKQKQRRPQGMRREGNGRRNDRKE
jgi:Spy/CpxP family protein refolding chaperone